MSKKTRAFSLAELMIAVVIIGLIAALVLPNFGKAFSKTDERNGIVNLKAMRTAVRAYLANTDLAVIPDMNNLNDANTGLGLSLTDPRSAYSCWGMGGSPENGCQSDLPDGSIIHFHLSGFAHNTDGSIHCTIAPCPSCPDAGTGDCG